MTGTDAWMPLADELDLWQVQGLSAAFWLRDDDAVAPGSALERLAQLSERFDAPVLLAIIPMLAQPALAGFLRGAPSLLPCQHGAWHRSHAPAGEKNAEFGASREIDAALVEIAQGKARLDALLGPAVLPVFVPPWNRIGAGLAPRLPEFGLTGLSCFRGFALDSEGGPVLANTQYVIIYWHGGRIGRGAESLAAEMARQLAHHRQNAAGEATFGILTHHLVHDETAWTGLEALLGLMAHHAAARLVDPRRLFLEAKLG